MAENSLPENLRCSKSSFIYLVLAEGVMRNGNRVFKIGLSQNVRSRMIELQIGAPVRLHLQHYFEVSRLIRFYEPETIEKMLHDKFESFRLHGEWFALSKRQVRWFLTLDSSNYDKHIARLNLKNISFHVPIMGKLKLCAGCGVEFLGRPNKQFHSRECWLNCHKAKLTLSDLI